MTNQQSSNPEYTEKLKREEQVAELARADATTTLVEALNLKYAKEKLGQEAKESKERRREEKKERKVRELMEEKQRKNQAAEEALKLSEQEEEMTEEEEWLLHLTKEEKEDYFQNFPREVQTAH
jgi:hypothetical protein